MSGWIKTAMFGAWHIPSLSAPSPSLTIAIRHPPSAPTTPDTVRLETVTLRLQAVISLVKIDLEPDSCHTFTFYCVQYEPHPLTLFDALNALWVHDNYQFMTSLIWHKCMFCVLPIFCVLCNLRHYCTSTQYRYTVVYSMSTTRRAVL